MHFFTSSQCFWMALTLQNLKLGGNLEFSWYSCNILRYCSNRCIVWFFIPENCPAQVNRKFPVQLYVKIQILFEPPFWICKWANHLSFLAMCPWTVLYCSLQQMDKTTSTSSVCQWPSTDRWFSPDTPISSTNKTDRHDITEILLQLALNTINQKLSTINLERPLQRNQ